MKKTIIAITTLFFSVGIIAFISCSKHVDSTEVELAEYKTTSALNPTSIPLGKVSKDGEPYFYFDKNKYIYYFEKYIKKNIGNNYVLEDVKILDRDPTNLDSIAELQQTLFDLESGKTINLFSLLDKVTDGHTTEYIFTSDKPKRDIVCEGTNCETGGCLSNADRTDCTPCGNDKGNCKKTDKPNSSGITWKDVIGWGIPIIVAILSKIL